jgi:hypothetical protein
LALVVVDVRGHEDGREDLLEFVKLNLLEDDLDHVDDVLDLKPVLLQVFGAFDEVVDGLVAEVVKCDVGAAPDIIREVAIDSVGVAENKNLNQLFFNCADVGVRVQLLRDDKLCKWGLAIVTSEVLLN